MSGVGVRCRVWGSRCMVWGGGGGGSGVWCGSRLEFGKHLMCQMSATSVFRHQTL